LLCVQYLLGIKVVESGNRPAGPTLYAIKHEAFFEAIEMLHRFDYPAGFAKQELFAIPGWGRVARNYGLIPVARDQGAKALRAMLAAARPAIAAGRPIIIFPEGTRVPHGQRAPLQAGFAALYKLLGLQVVPVAVDSGPLYHRRWKQSGTIRLHFGEVIPPGLPRDEIEARVLDAINCLNP
jgi:1-acyl-sn-glycerol-3-phosphate acyltransferase